MRVSDGETRENRTGRGLDTSLLQAVDSYLNAVYTASASTKEDRLALQTDPCAREQFREAVDRFVDLAPTFLVVPLEKRGHLAPVGHLIAEHAGTLAEATTQHPIHDAAGVKYYKDFFGLLAADYYFAKSAIGWGWFQVLDTDVLLGYTTRMGVSDDLAFVKPDMRSQFIDAIQDLPADFLQKVVSRAAETTDRLGHSVQDLARFDASLKSRLRRAKGAEEKALCDTARQILSSVGREVKSFSTVADSLGLTADNAADLFQLAYVGSWCRRGWQYNEVYTRQRANQVLGYDAHFVRSDFIRLTTPSSSLVTSRPDRSYWWSWGEVIARAVKQRPSRFSRERVIDLLLEIKALGISNSYDHDSREQLELFLESDECFVRSERFKQLMEKHQLFAAKDEFHDRFSAIAPALILLVPGLGLGVVASIVGSWAQGVAWGAASAGATELVAGLKDSLFGRAVKRAASWTSELLEEVWITSITPGQRSELSGGAEVSDSPIGPLTGWVARNTKTEESQS